MAPHSSTLAWKIPWTEEPGRLQSMWSQRVGHDWATSLSLFTFMHWRRKWQPTPVFLPGESQGRGSLVGCCLWGRDRVGHDWSDLAAAEYTHYFDCGDVFHRCVHMPTVYFKYVQFIVYQLYLNEAVKIIKENISICWTWQSKFTADSFLFNVCVCSQCEVGLYQCYWNYLINRLSLQIVSKFFI